MKKSVIIEAKRIHKIFDNALRSLWLDQNVSNMEVKDQIRLFKEKFHANLTGGHFDNINKPPSNTRKWNTQDAIIEFDTKEDYVLFILEWS